MQVHEFFIASRHHYPVGSLGLCQSIAADQNDRDPKNPFCDSASVDEHMSRSSPISYNTPLLLRVGMSAQNGNNSDSERAQVFRAHI